MGVNASSSAVFRLVLVVGITVLEIGITVLEIGITVLMVGMTAPIIAQAYAILMREPAELGMVVRTCLAAPQRRLLRVCCNVVHCVATGLAALQHVARLCNAVHLARRTTPADRSKGSDNWLMVIPVPLIGTTVLNIRNKGSHNSLYRYH